MLTPQAEALLDQMQTMIAQSHALQLEMLATWRIVLQAPVSGDPAGDEASTPLVGIAMADSSLPDKPTFRVEEVAQILGIGRATAYRAVHLGQIPSLRLGARLFIPRTSLVGMLGAGAES
jgi:excisionase family DNA binding protein